MGNDATAEGPGCAAIGLSAAACGDRMVSHVSQRMVTSLDAVHAANKKIRVLGFGYDIMFGGLGCTDFAKKIFPQCWRGIGDDASEVEKAGAVRCFNEQFTRIQTTWESLASTRPWVDTINILGSCQAAGGYAGASPGKPDMSRFAPAKYFRDTLMCIHPSLVPVDTCGAAVGMEQMYEHRTRGPVRV